MALFHYTRLAIGIKMSLDVTHSMITKIFNGLDYVCFINDCNYFVSCGTIMLCVY